MKTTTLTVHFDYLSETFAVVNTVDGRIVDRFDTREAAEALAQRYESIEAERIANR